MNTRYGTQFASWQEIHDYFNLLGPAQNVRARYNIAPTQDAPVIRLNEDGRRELSMLRWGLIPFWAKDEKIGYRTINARSETVAEKPSFREAYKKRRCLIPATGFYEWQKTPDGKVPYHIVPLDELWAFAGLWERWEKGDEPLETFTILTTEAAQSIEQIHPRMPTILEPADYDAWLELDTGKDDLAQLAGKQFPDARMRAYPVSTRVNTPKNDDAELIKEMGAA
ncbi:MAG: SOS response-associated peptidase [Alphaproteobacteria bacterium]